MTKELHKKTETGVVIKPGTLENQANMVYIGIGSNLGSKTNNIENAKHFLILNNINIIKSSIYFFVFSSPTPKSKLGSSTGGSFA